MTGTPDDRAAVSWLIRSHIVSGSVHTAPRIEDPPRSFRTTPRGELLRDGDVALEQVAPGPVISVVEARPV